MTHPLTKTDSGSRVRDPREGETVPDTLSPKGTSAGKRGARWRLSRITFYLHLWVGVLTAVVLLGISITGIILNHKRGLGLMPDVPHHPTAPFRVALPLAELALAALDAAPDQATPGWNQGDPLEPDLIDRMDVRPGSGYVKVRLDDNAVTEVTVDLSSGDVLHVGQRGDVFLEKLHSGEAFGRSFVLLADIGAVGLIITLITGYWLWLAPKVGRGHRAGTSREVS